jgi:PAS domain S-box-containing protein
MARDLFDIPTGPSEVSLASARFILENALDCVAAVDPAWRFTFLNKRARRILGGERDLVGQIFWDVFPQAVEHKLGQTFRQTMADGITREVEAYYAPMDQWFACRTIRTSEGIITFFRVTTADRERDTALKTTEARLQSIFSNLNVGVTILNGDGVILDANRAAEHILGLPRHELCGMSVDSAAWRAIDANGRELTGHEFPAMVALRTGSVVRQFVMGVYNPERAQQRWLSIDACPIRVVPEAAPSHVYVILSDITERLKEERELKLSRLFMAMAQKVTAIGSAAIDFRTGKWNWSEETCRIYGVDPRTFVPSTASLAALIHPDDREALLSAPDLARTGVTPPPIEYRIRRTDGQERLLRRDAVLIHDDDGQIIGIVGAVQDVTELRAKEREKELLQIQLNHAQRLDALGKFAGGIAHDLNNTLVPVLALSEVIANSFSPHDERLQLIGMIQSAAEKGRDLLGQVLAFTRRDPPNRQAVHLDEFLRSAMGLLRASTPSSIELIAHTIPIPPVFADPSQLHQVLMNLLTNAAHAIGSQPGRVEIILNKGPIPGTVAIPADTATYAILSVTDTGCGMNEEVSARIFEPFFTTKHAGAGTGLGLSVVHGIVIAHGGKITVQSVPGAGTRFDIYLPFAK